MIGGSYCSQSSFWDVGFMVFGVLAIIVLMNLTITLPVYAVSGSPKAAWIVATIIGSIVPYVAIWSRFNAIKKSCAEDCATKAERDEAKRIIAERSQSTPRVV